MQRAGSNGGVMCVVMRIMAFLFVWPLGMQRRDSTASVDGQVAVVRCAQQKTGLFGPTRDR